MAAYSSYTFGMCVHRAPCAKRNPEACRNCRQAAKQ